MGLGEMLVITAFVALGAMVQGCLGIGLTLVAGPVLLLIEPAYAPGPLLVGGQLISLRHVLVERSFIDRAVVKRAAGGMPIGIGIGLLLLTLMSEATLNIVIGLATAVAAAALLGGLKVARSGTVDTAGGASIGFCSVVAALPGPPAAVAFSSMPAATMRATVAFIVIVVATVGAIGLAVTNRFGFDDVRLLATMVPGLIVGLVVARFVRGIIDRHWFRPAILVFALVGGLTLVVRTVASLG